MIGRLFLLFVLVPLCDLWVLFWVGSRLGPVTTLAIVLLTAALGATLCRREGARTLAALRDNLWAGRVLPEQLADAVLVLIGGAFLLTPGFLTDGVGLAMVLPVTRPLARAVLQILIPLRFSVDLGPGFERPPHEPNIRDIDARVRNAGTDSESNRDRVE